MSPSTQRLSPFGGQGHGANVKSTCCIVPYTWAKDYSSALAPNTSEEVPWAAIVCCEGLKSSNSIAWSFITMDSSTTNFAKGYNYSTPPVPIGTYTRPFHKSFSSRFKSREDQRVLATHCIRHLERRDRRNKICQRHNAG